MKGVTKTRWALFALFTVLSLFWMYVIFGFSSKNAEESTVQSNTVTEFLLSIFEPGFDELDETLQLEIIEKYDGFVRKCAHFAAYALLGFLTCLSAGSCKYLPDNKLLPITVSLPVCVLFSVSDEFHQTFVDGRSGQLSDVIVDSLGAVTGNLCAIAAVIILFGVLNKKKRNNKKSEPK